jgi:hypothetical protein
MMMDPRFRTDLMRFRMEEIERAASEHHRAHRRTSSPRRPGAGHGPSEH